MNFKFLKILLLSVMIAGISSSLFASATVQIRLDSVNLLMGKMTTLHLSVTQPKGAKGSFPIFGRIRDNGIIPICGDSVELRAPSKIDTLVSGNSVTINYDIPLQAFDSGYYRLPEFAYVSGRDTVSSKSLAIKVVPVLAEADTPIHDYASVSGPENPSIFDHVPDWVVDYWWVLLIVLLALALALYAVRRYKSQGSLLPKKPEPTPYEAAVSALRTLKEKKLWEQGMEKEYYTDLTDILRHYLFRRFGINAAEMTSRQILAALKKNKEIADKRVYFRQILDMADFVKFAKVRPLPDDNVKSYDNALRCVEETRPVQPEDSDTDGSSLDLKSKEDSAGPVSVKGGEK